jgi:glycerol kinase
LTTIAYRIAGHTTYALEGSILSAGTTVQWLRDGLGLFEHAEDIEQLANSVPDSGGVYLVPAFTGLGAPYWELEARGAIVGLTRSSSRAHVARAALDSVAFQTWDLLDAMSDDGVAPSVLRVDGGMSRNSLLMQRLADILDMPIQRPHIVEATAWGAACLAGLGAGIYQSLDDTVALWRAETSFEPKLDTHCRQLALDGWHCALRAVTLAKP